MITKNKFESMDRLALKKDDKYWTLVLGSLQYSINQKEQEQFLIKELIKLSSNEIIEFDHTSTKLFNKAYSSEMHCAANLIMFSGCSDSSFFSFLYWLISRGKNTYYAAISNPDNLINHLVKGEREYSFEAFCGIPTNVYLLKTNNYLPYDNSSDASLDDEENISEKIVFNWTLDDPESQKAICPRLFHKFYEP